MTAVVGPRRILAATVQDGSGAYLAAVCSAAANGVSFPAVRPHTQPAGNGAIPATWRVPAGISGEIVVLAQVDGDERSGTGRATI